MSEQMLSDIEQASLRAWPALEELEMGNWRLRFSRGFTKRGNSVSVTHANSHVFSNSDLLDRIQKCEQHYHDRKQPAIFRIVHEIERESATSTAPSDIDKVLASRNYRYCDVSLVLVKKLDAAALAPTSIRYVDLPAWLVAYQQISNSPDHVEHLHRLILEGIQADLLLALSEHKQLNIACALGVVDGPLLGLFDIATHEKFRLQGFARALVQELCAQGFIRGAKYAYLQVQEDNIAASTLYAALGFSPAYRYGYRIEGDFSG